MPSKSEKQKRFMAAAAHNPSFAKRAGIKQSVAKEFNRADQTHARLRSASRKKK
jgi:DNA-binding cell septation regulator SpoVG